MGSYRSLPRDTDVRAIQVVNEHVFLGTQTGLWVFSVTTPTKPNLLGHFLPDVPFNDIDVFRHQDESYALLSSVRAIILMNITNPAAPEVVFKLQTGAHNTAIVETEGIRTAYISPAASPGILALDLTDPANHVVRISESLRGPNDNAIYLHNTNSRGGFVYANIEAGDAPIFRVYRDSDTHLDLLGTWAPETPFLYSHGTVVQEIEQRTVAIHSGEGIGSQLHIIDVDPTSPQFLQTIGEWKSDSQGVSLHKMKLVGRTLFLTHYQAGLRVLYLEDPATLIEIGRVNNWVPSREKLGLFEGAYDVDVDDHGMVFVAVGDGEPGFYIAKILQP